MQSPGSWDPESLTPLLRNYVRTREWEDFKKFYLEVAPQLHASARRILAHVGSSEDVVQDAFLEFFARLDKPSLFPAIRERPALWLLRVTINKAINIVRRSRKWREIRQSLTEENQSEALSFHVDLLPAQDLAAFSNDLGEAIPKLPDRQRVALVLWYFEGWTHRQIGQQLSMTGNAVTQTVARAEKSLAKMLKHWAPVVAKEQER